MTYHLLQLLLTYSALIVAAFPAASKTPILKPDQLVILSVTDVKGKTSPCGCHTPKGGLSRQASYIDSIRADYGQVVWVDNGGFFPEQNDRQDLVAFLMDGMKLVGVDAVGVGERDLRYGAAFLEVQAKRAKLPLVCANLVRKANRKPFVAPYVIEKTGTLKVGLFGLIGPKANLGPARDSLLVLDPAETATRTAQALRKAGADVVILLSQLGKVESEDLVAAVEGIDAVVVGHDTPILQKGRMIKNTVACYGGEQGQYMCQTVLTLDARRRAVNGQADAVMLSPEVGEKPEIQKLVKAFEDDYNDRFRKAEAERQVHAQPQPKVDDSHRYLGDEVCGRCHAAEAQQWKTTAHSLALQTLVDVQKESTPECIPCHVVGYQKSGGFVSAAATPHLGNVQCENCHGMGTDHDGGGKTTPRVTEQTCVQCHNPERDPEFDFAKKLPMIVHGNTSGESIKTMQARKASGRSTMMKGHGGGH